MSEHRVRLFTALELPPVARSALARWCSEQLAEIPGARRLKPESFHVTLCFLGWHAVEDVAEIARACRMVASQRRVALTLGPALWRPERRPRALAVGLNDGDGALTRLQSSLARSLQAGGWYEPERRRFLGHVTVARIARGRAGTPSTRDRPGTAPALATPSPLRFLSADMTLFRSHLDSGGARYEPLETVELSR